MVDFDNTSESTNESATATFQPILIAFISMQQLVFVSACTGNLVVIIVFTKYLKFLSKTNKFIVSLAVADFFTGVASGLQLFYFLDDRLNSNMLTCFLRYQIIGFMTMTSQLTVTFTTFDRFVAICYPHHYQRLMSNKTTNCLIAFAWVFSLLLVTIPFAGANHWEDGVPCIFYLLFDKAVYLASAITIYIFMLSSFVMYICIMHKAWKMHQRVIPITETIQNKERMQRLAKNIRSAKAVGIVTAAFSVCWAPYYVFQFRYGLAIHDDVNVLNVGLSMWLVFLGISNSIVNPFVYAWHRPNFRSSCKQILCCKATFTEPATTTASNLPTTS